jgi:hypothetical protein
MLVNFASFPELAEQISRDPGVIFLSGICWSPVLRLFAPTISG